MILNDVMIIIFIIWWCITFMSMCYELLYHIRNVFCLYTRGCCDARDWILVDTAFYTTIGLMITEVMLFIWR